MASLARFADELRRTAFFTACIDIARRTLPAPVLVWLRSQMVRNLHGGPREVFAEIYRRNIWGYQETASGGGSTLHYTQKMREALPELIGDLKIGTLLDLPCGDFHWMSEVKLPITRYIGSDIVPRLVEIARIRYGRPQREFRTLDLCKDVLPQVDLLLCRDCLMHLSEEMIFLALANIIRSDIKYLLISSYPDGRNRSIRLGDWFPINLCAAPYNFPPPLRTIDDWVAPFDRRHLALWEIESLRRIVGSPSAMPTEAVVRKVG
jgi:SAM-dependent methyltransferase